MSRDEIIKLIREAGIHMGGHPMNPLNAYVADFERFAALVAAAEREALAEPEPVPEMWGSPDGYWVENQYLYLRSDRECFTIPLYTAPPTRRPLTDEEILTIARDHYNPHQRPEVSFARAIEHAHKIGGNGE